MYKYRSTFAPPEYKTASEFRRDRLASDWSHRLSSTTTARLGPELQKNLQPRVEVLGVHVARERQLLFGQDARAAFEEIRHFEPSGQGPQGQQRESEDLGETQRGVAADDLGMTPADNPRTRYRGAGRTRAATDAYFRHMLASNPESTLYLPLEEEAWNTTSSPLTLEDLSATDRQRWAFLPTPPPPPAGAIQVGLRSK